MLVAVADIPISYLTSLPAYLTSQMKSNNVNGPGSGNIRVYQITVDTFAAHQAEIQTVTTACRDGENLGGGFVLHYNGYRTSLIPFDASASWVKTEMETSLNPVDLDLLSRVERADATDPDYKTAGVGRVDVSSVLVDSNQGGSRQWKITFLSAVGDIGTDSTPLTATNLLTGIDADVQVATTQNGNTISGNFYLDFLAQTSGPYAHDTSADDMETALLSSHSRVRRRIYSQRFVALLIDSPDAISNATNTTSFTTRFARRSSCTPS